MKEKLLFRVYKGRGHFRIITNNGEIVDIVSPNKEYKMEELESTLKIAASADLDQFLELSKSLRLDSSHYKMCKKILKETKNEMEANIKKITKLFPDY